MSQSIHPHDRAMHDLICSSLRGMHTRNMKADKLIAYTSNLGVALHNIPSELRENGRVPVHTLQELNALDPGGSKNKWGGWCVMLCRTIGQELPDSPQQ